MESSTSTVIVKRHSEIGSVGDDPKVTVTSIQLTAQGSNPKVESGIQVVVSQGGQCPDKGIARVDYDAIEALLKGIDAISDLDMSPAPFRDFEASYRVLGGLCVSVVPTKRGGFDATVESGNEHPVTAKLNGAELAKFRTLLENAKSTLDSARHSKRQ